MLLKFIQMLVQLDWPFRLAAPLMGRFNPFIPSNRLDPYSHYRALREAAPVYPHPVLGMVILSRYEDVTSVLADKRFSVDRTKTGLFDKLVPKDKIQPGFYQAITRSLVMVDPPDHTRLRNLVTKAFTPRVVESLRPRIQELVDDLIDDLERKSRAGHEIDFMADFAFPLPIVVIAEMLGVPTADRERLKEWSDGLSAILDLIHEPGGLQTAEQAYETLAEYFSAVFEERRSEPQSDLISALVAAEEEGDRLTEAELLSICMLILGAGHETTSNLLGNGLWALCHDPVQKQRLIDDPALAPNAVEELLRFDAPIQMTDRVATCDLEIDGVPVKKGQLVGLLFGAANRDPERFEEPDRLDLTRRDNRHVSFSWGPHFCLGAALTRAEGQIAFRSLLERFPDIQITESEPERVRSMVLRGFKRLSVELGAPCVPEAPPEAANESGETREIVPVTVEFS